MTEHEIRCVALGTYTNYTGPLEASPLSKSENRYLQAVVQKFSAGESVPKMI